MVKKTNKKVQESEEEMQEGDFQEGMKEEEPQDSEEESEEQEENELEVFKQMVDTRFAKLENAVTVNQKYIKEIWKKVQKLEEDFKLLYEER